MLQNLHRILNSFICSGTIQEEAAHIKLHKTPQVHGSFIEKQSNWQFRVSCSSSHPWKSIPPQKLFTLSSQEAEALKTPAGSPPTPKCNVTIWVESYKCNRNQKSQVEPKTLSSFDFKYLWKPTSLSGTHHCCPILEHLSSAAENVTNELMLASRS